MAGPQITFDEFQTMLRRVDDEVPAYLRREMTRLRLIGQAAAVQAARTRLRVRTGRLSQSITSTMTSDDDGIAVDLVAGGGRRQVSYARIQEFGGTVSPRNKYLAIPMPAALTAVGARKGRYDSALGLRGIDGFFLRTKADRLFFVERAGKNKLRFLFYMHPGSVKIKAARYLAHGFDEMQSRMDSLLRAAIEQVE